MTFAKAFVTGSVVKAPEKRFTQNDMATASMTINLDQNNETLVRVLAFGQLAETICATVAQGDNIAVEGRLQVNSFKLPNGIDRKVYEINANAIEKMSTQAGFNGAASNPQSASNSASNASNGNIVSFNQDEIAQDLIDDDEIPF